MKEFVLKTSTHLRSLRSQLKRKPDIIENTFFSNRSGCVNLNNLLNFVLSICLAYNIDSKFLNAKRLQCLVSA